MKDIISNFRKLSKIRKRGEKGEKSQLFVNF